MPCLEAYRPVMWIKSEASEFMSINLTRIRIPRFREQNHVDVPGATVAEMAQWITAQKRLLVLTGAGCSTASGIPAYRDSTGSWQRRDPIMYQDFQRSAKTRRRYWARSFLGWPLMQQAKPNKSHIALAALEQKGQVSRLITQNVDNLHDSAGHANCINLHGTLSEVICLQCEQHLSRNTVQQLLTDLNAQWQAEVKGINPDGDVELDNQAYPGFNIADCPACGGIIKPNVVFFGESVPVVRMQQVNDALHSCDAVLAIGTSLVVWSGYRIVRNAATAGLPVAAINDGRTRADHLLQFKLDGDCGEQLAGVLRMIDQ